MDERRRRRLALRDRERAQQHRLAAQLAANEGKPVKARHHRRAADRIERKLRSAGD